MSHLADIAHETHDLWIPVALQNQILCSKELPLAVLKDRQLLGPVPRVAFPSMQMVISWSY